MTRNLWKRALVLVLDERTAIARCDGCDFSERYTGRSTPRAYENAKRHAGETGHVARVKFTHQTAYQASPDEPQPKGWTAWSTHDA